MPAHLSLNELTLRYSRASAPVFEGLSLEVEQGELLVLLGPSGSGKTSILRSIAGFLEPRRGTLLLDGQTLAGVPPEQRGTALVFQQPTLFPHLSVAENVAFGPRMRGVGKAERLQQARAMLADVQLAGYERRYPHQLSGGQRQRVALARALAAQPRVLLLDEPFASLDPGLRDEMRDMLRALQRAQAVTTILVTHDQQEAALLADRVALLLDGQIAQLGPPQHVYARPASLSVARFLGIPNVISGLLAEDGQTVSTELGPLRVIGPRAAPGPVTLVIRPEHIGLHLPDQTGIAARIRQRDFLGALYRYTLQAGPLSLQAVTVDGSFEPGAELRLTLAPEQLWVLSGA